MTKHMKSHKLARAMQETAEFLLSRPEFETPSTDHSLYLGRYWDEDGKNAMIGMVKAVGHCKKDYDGSDLKITIHTPLGIWATIDRGKVCHKVQEEKWECEALLTAVDEAEMDAAIVAPTFDRTPLEIVVDAERENAGGVPDGVVGL